MFLIGALLRMVLGGVVGGSASAAGKDIYDRVKDKRSVRRDGHEARHTQSREDPERLADQVEKLEADVRRLKLQVAALERELAERGGDDDGTGEDE